MVSAVRSVFASSGPGPSGRIERLRQKLCAVEATTGLAGEHAAPLALGIPLIDRALGGGLSCGALHEIAAVCETETAAATGFALALAARGSTRSNSAAGRSVLWIAEDLSLAENGAPYGPGLAEAGNAPERLVTVAAAHSRDVLWAMEEALRCRAVGVVIGELRTRVIDPVATRRLSLAAAAGGTLGLILRTAPDDEPSAAATRWVIAALASEASGQRSHSISARAGHSPEAGSSARAAAPSSPLAGNGDVHGIGPPRLAARLVRNRRGHLGAWIVEWNSVEQRLELATHPEPVAAAAFDRPLRWRAKRAASAATL